MTRTDAERAAFRSATDREAYLRTNSHLPGSRANLELLSAAGEEVDLDWARAWATRPAGDDPTDVFVIGVALVALGRFAAADARGVIALMRVRATDDEWRIRETVAIGLQRLGDERPEQLAETARAWVVQANPLVARAAVAAVAEPRLLRTAAAVDAALDVLDAATSLVMAAPDRRDAGVRVLRQALGYAWSVVVVADVGRVWPRFTTWAESDDPDAEWIVRENLKKNRLRRLGLKV